MFNYDLFCFYLPFISLERLGQMYLSSQISRVSKESSVGRIYVLLMLSAKRFTFKIIIRSHVLPLLCNLQSWSFALQTSLFLLIATNTRQILHLCSFKVNSSDYWTLVHVSHFYTKPCTQVGASVHASQMCTFEKTKREQFRPKLAMFSLLLFFSITKVWSLSHVYFQYSIIKNERANHKSVEQSLGNTFLCAKKTAGL